MKREEIIEQGMRLLKDVQNNEHFRTVDGRVLKSVRELVLLLETFNDEHFRHHVNEHRNDFAEWVRYSVGDADLADRIAQADSQNAIQRAISQRLEDLEAMLLSYEMEPIVEKPEITQEDEPAEEEREPTDEPEQKKAHEPANDDELEALVGDAHSGDKFSRDDLLEEIENAISQAQAQIEIERQTELRAEQDLTGEPEAAVESPAERKLERDAEKARKKEEKNRLKQERKKAKTEKTPSKEKSGFSFSDFLIGFVFGAIIGGVLGAIIVILLG